MGTLSAHRWMLYALMQLTNVTVKLKRTNHTNHVLKQIMEYEKKSGKHSSIISIRWFYLSLGWRPKWERTFLATRSPGWWEKIYFSWGKYFIIFQET